MTRPALNTCLLPLVVALCLCGHVSAWEIEIKGNVPTAAAVVRLGDISRITGLAAADAQVLEQIILAPGPSRSHSRSLSASQIRKILQGRGVELDACRFTGPSRAVIVYAADAGPAALQNTNSSGSDTSKRTSPWDVVRPASYRSKGGTALVGGVEQEVANVISAQLLQLSNESVPWNVGVTISGRALRDLPRRWSDLTIEGLDTATEGDHQLVACFVSESGDVRVRVEANATRMVEMVVPIRPLKRGEVITVRDVKLRRVSGRIDQENMVRRLDEVVGRQVQLPLQAGEPMPAKALKKPILVKRREEIEVVARRGGVKVRTNVWALDEGALGDTITVERLDGRKKVRFVARVVGVQQVEVCASNASAHRIAER